MEYFFKKFMENIQFLISGTPWKLRERLWEVGESRERREKQNKSEGVQFKARPNDTISGRMY